MTTELHGWHFQDSPTLLALIRHLSNPSSQLFKNGGPFGPGNLTMPALHWAAYYQSPQAAAILVEKGCSPDTMHCGTFFPTVTARQLDSLRGAKLFPASKL